MMLMCLMRTRIPYAQQLLVMTRCRAVQCLMIQRCYFIYIHSINLNPLTLHLYTFLEINCVFIYRKRILRSYTANTQHLLSAEIKTAKRRQTCKSFNYVLFRFNPNTTFTSWMSFEHIYF